jgi:hypothetical protein
MMSNDELTFEGEDSSANLLAVIRAKDDTIAELKRKLESLASLGAFTINDSAEASELSANAEAAEAATAKAEAAEAATAKDAAFEAAKESTEANHKSEEASHASTPHVNELSDGKRSASSFEEKAKVAHAKLEEAAASMTFKKEMDKYNQVRTFNSQNKPPAIASFLRLISAPLLHLLNFHPLAPPLPHHLNTNTAHFAPPFAFYPHIAGA